MFKALSPGLEVSRALSSPGFASKWTQPPSSLPQVGLPFVSSSTERKVPEFLNRGIRAFSGDAFFVRPFHAGWDSVAPQ